MSDERGLAKAIAIVQVTHGKSVIKDRGKVRIEKRNLMGGGLQRSQEALVTTKYERRCGARLAVPKAGCMDLFML